MSRTLKQAPTKFMFALKSDESINMFEKPEDDYVRYFCGESLEAVADWVLAFRFTKVTKLFNLFDLGIYFSNIHMSQNRIIFDNQFGHGEVRITANPSSS